MPAIVSSHITWNRTPSHPSEHLVLSSDGHDSHSFKPYYSCCSKYLNSYLRSGFTPLSRRRRLHVQRHWRRRRSIVVGPDDDFVTPQEATTMQRHGWRRRFINAIGGDDDFTSCVATTILQRHRSWRWDLAKSAKKRNDWQGGIVNISSFIQSPAFV
jgi:hypothetical protein